MSLAGPNGTELPTWIICTLPVTIIGEQKLGQNRQLGAIALAPDH